MNDAITKYRAFIIALLCVLIMSYLYFFLLLHDFSNRLDDYSDVKSNIGQHNCQEFIKINEIANQILKLKYKSPQQYKYLTYDKITKYAKYIYIVSENCIIKEKKRECIKLDTNLLISMIWVESRFLETATSASNARGLGQIVSLWLNDSNVKTLGNLNKNDLYDPMKNLIIMSYIIRKYTYDFKDQEIMLSEYSGDELLNTNYVKYVNNTYKFLINK